MIDKHSITILMPVYNEESLLAQALPLILDFASKNIADYELLIIESGSQDNSGIICDSFSSININVRVIHEGTRNGFGSALKLGYKEASKNWIWLVTSDIPFPLDAIITAEKYFDDYDCIFSYRSHDPRGYSRRIQSFIYNSIIKLVLGLKVKHINSAFKVLNRGAVSGLELLSNRWFIDAELLYWVTKFNFRYIEIPVPIIEREGGVSTVGSLAFIDILKEMFFFLFKKRKLNKFNPRLNRNVKIH